MMKPVTRAGAREQAKAYRAAAVVHVEHVALETDRFDQPRHVIGQVLEGGGEYAGFRRLGRAEADVVGGDQVELVGQRPDQRVVFRAAAEKTVQEQDRRGRDIAGLAVADRSALHQACALTGDGRHWNTS